MSNRKKREVIIPCGVNIILPIALVFGIYLIIHGHLSPGGGFQGGVILGGALAIFYLGYGREAVSKIFKIDKFKSMESIGALAFILLGTLGLTYGASFFSNIIYKGNLGDLFSSGTIFLMNFAVGYKVLAGITVLILAMLSTLKFDNKGDS